MEVSFSNLFGRTFYANAIVSTMSGAIGRTLWLNNAA